ncbi:hypothetical protein [Streptomyces griseorubiginosus]|uniref:hypothetical protein n=1 Tax=Streptomyces griseorubiginosus TaxID=67304 RepID=UPI0036EDA0B7
MARHVTTTIQQALEEIQAAGLRYTGEGLPPMVPVTLTFPTECVECGRPRRSNLNRIRSGLNCPHLFVKADVAEQLAAKAGWKPRKPYPGARSIPWALACINCSLPIVLTLTQVLARKKTCRCPAFVEEMRAGGYEPQTPYPGSDRKPWPSICTTCKTPRTPYLMTVRSGRLCAHKNPPSHKAKGTP